MSSSEPSAVDRLRHDAELAILGAGLTALGHTVLPPPDDASVPVLRVDIGLGADDLHLEIAFAGQSQLADDCEQVLLTVAVHSSVPDLRREDLQRAIEIVNPAMTLGQFSLNEGSVDYRYVTVLPHDATFDPAEISALIHVFAAEQAHFGDYLEAIIEDEIPLSLLPKILAETQ